MAVGLLSGLRAGVAVSSAWLPDCGCAGLGFLVCLGINSLHGVLPLAIADDRCLVYKDENPGLRSSILLV